jgi:integration host factor beta subunit
MFSGPRRTPRTAEQIWADVRAVPDIRRWVDFGRGDNKEKTELMKKADLVDVVAQQKNLPRPQVEATIDALIDAVAEGLAKGERIDLRGFGAFAVRESAARAGRNPQTGETIQIAARRVPTFKAGKELRDKVNKPSA